MVQCWCSVGLVLWQCWWRNVCVRWRYNSGHVVTRVGPSTALLHPCTTLHNNAQHSTAVHTAHCTELHTALNSAHCTALRPSLGRVSVPGRLLPVLCSQFAVTSPGPAPARRTGPDLGPTELREIRQNKTRSQLDLGDFVIPRQHCFWLGQSTVTSSIA